MVPSMPDDVAVHGVSFTHDLPTVHPRRTKRWEKVLRDSPGVWGQLQKASDSANSRHYAKTYPEGFRFAIRVLTEEHPRAYGEVGERWLFGRFDPPVES